MPYRHRCQLFFFLTNNRTWFHWETCQVHSTLCGVLVTDHEVSEIGLVPSFSEVLYDLIIDYPPMGELIWGVDTTIAEFRLFS